MSYKNSLACRGLRSWLAPLAMSCVLCLIFGALGCASPAPASSSPGPASDASSASDAGPDEGALIAFPRASWPCQGQGRQRVDAWWRARASYEQRAVEATLTRLAWPAAEHVRIPHHDRASSVKVRLRGDALEVYEQTIALQDPDLAAHLIELLPPADVAHVFDADPDLPARQALDALRAAASSGRTSWLLYRALDTVSLVPEGVEPGLAQLQPRLATVMERLADAPELRDQRLMMALTQSVKGCPTLQGLLEDLTARSSDPPGALAMRVGSDWVRCACQGDIELFTALMSMLLESWIHPQLAIYLPMDAEQLRLAQPLHDQERWGELMVRLARQRADASGAQAPE